MIEIESWATHLVSEVEADQVPKYIVAFTDAEKCDDRCDWTANYIRNVSHDVVTAEYHPFDALLSIGDVTYTLQNLDDYYIPEGNILIDSTSLSLPEILHLFTLLNIKKRDFDVLYIQPTDYAKNEPTGIENVASFHLSDDGIGIQQLPPYVGMSVNSKIFFFLGWEGHRLGALIYSDEFDIKNITCLIGVPPYQIGWENVTLSSNYKQLMDINNSTNVRFKYAGANDPVNTYEIIEAVYKSTEYDKSKLSLAPFGTKPSAIAAAQFAINNSNLIMLYDFAKKKRKRSSGTDLLHIWSFKYFS